MSITIQDLIQIISDMSDKFNKYKYFLTNLDEIIGDGDHGINMSNGFVSTKERINENNVNDFKGVFRILGLEMISTTGGRAGELYGALFLKAAEISVDKDNISFEDFREILTEGIEVIKFEGNTKKGDKTILDSLIPALEEINYGINNKLSYINTMENAVNLAREHVAFTMLIAAKKGRASYLGDKSLGYQDPGATSSLMMLEVILDFLKNKNK